MNSQGTGNTRDFEGGVYLPVRVGSRGMRMSCHITRMKCWKDCGARSGSSRRSSASAADEPRVFSCSRIQNNVFYSNKITSHRQNLMT